MKLLFILGCRIIRVIGVKSTNLYKEQGQTRAGLIYLYIDR